MPYHVNPRTGDPGQCSAKVQCPFGGDADHYETREAAAAAFEEAMGPASLQGISRAQEIAIMDNLLEGIESLPADLEGSVPDTSPYREAADAFVIAVAVEENSLAGVDRVARRYFQSNDQAEALVGGFVLSEVKRLGPDLGPASFGE